ncbi:hypothetical protein ACSFBC_05285 [Variovorax sp. LT1R16]
MQAVEVDAEATAHAKHVLDFSRILRIRLTEKANNVFPLEPRSKNLIFYVLCHAASIAVGIGLVRLLREPSGRIESRGCKDAAVKKPVEQPCIGNENHNRTQREPLDGTKNGSYWHGFSAQGGR